MRRRDRAKAQTRRERNQAMKRLLFSNGFRGILIVLIAVFGLLNVFQITKLSTTGYKISELERQIQDLENENKRLKVTVAEHTSMAYIQENIDTLDMVPVEQAEFVHLPGTVVAQR